MVDPPERDLKETRSGGYVESIRTLADFIGKYNSSDIYLVSDVPEAMREDVRLLPCLRCGGFQRFLDQHKLWIGSGGSKSVIHYDDQDNINCMIAGHKRFILMHPRYKTQFEAHPNSPENKFGWVDSNLDRSVPGYGAFMGAVDVDRVDLIRFPGWLDVEWSYADLAPGDCLYIPYQWYHQVTAKPGRSINVHVWYFRPAGFSASSCKASVAARPPTFADCTWGYEPFEGHLGVRDGHRPLTKCKKRPVKGKEDL